ncbi:uncharacterized protein LODBEIA_P27320 [Lodderomyces beijingensis]|uniref:GPI inositol-deacylase n=1 Tax=Lodderomyces beijingensis TaxID=1775926 RepID=A0ABP0ZLI8_9ASCO
MHAQCFNGLPPAPSPVPVPVPVLAPPPPSSAIPRRTYSFAIQKNMNARPKRLLGSHKYAFHILLLLGGLLVLLTSLSYTSTLNGPDKSTCRVVWMYPAFARLKSFDESHTPYAKKYSLYLYREQGKDKMPHHDNGGDGGDIGLEGMPVLFIPGNAGSFKQGRSIAARTAELMSQDASSRRGLDFFTADFNEDFTAFHGRTMLDQAEFSNEAIKYILALYAQSKHQPPPSHVYIVGHSMGGIVARIMMTLPNYQHGSIETIVTLSSPHSTSPLTFDGDLIKVYDAVNKFWQLGFKPDEDAGGDGDDEVVSRVARERLRDVVVISLTGGALDSTLPADYTTLAGVVPESNGFTSFSTGMPLVWTPIDHLAVVWCQQLRTRIAKALLEVVNLDPKQDKWLVQRMEVFKRYFLSGFEPYAQLEQQQQQQQEQQQQSDSVEMELELEGQEVRELEINKRYTKGELSSGSRSVFKLNRDDDLHFTLLSSVPLDDAVSVYLCALSEVGNNKGNLLCSSVKQRETTIPRFTKDVTEVADSSYDGEKTPFYNLELDSKLLKKYDYVIIEGSTEPMEFFTAQLTTNKVSYKVPGNTFTLVTKGNSIDLPSNRPIMTDVRVPQAWNSLFVYKVAFKGLLHGANFNTFIRQYTASPFETKWHVNFNEPLALTMHGIAPFVPYSVHSDYSLNLQLWSDDVGEQDKDGHLKVTVSVDFLASLKLLILRYRLTLVAFNVALIALVICVQLGSSFDKFPSFLQTLARLNQRWWLVILVVLVAVNPILHIPFVKHIVLLINPAAFHTGRDDSAIMTSGASPFNVNLLYVGLKENLTVVGVILYLISNFIVAMTYIAILAVVYIVNFVISSLPFSSKKTTRLGTRVSKSSIYLFTKIQFVATAATLLLIPIYLPYQIVYLVCCFIQVINSIKAYPRPTTNNHHLFHFQISWLLLMLWILPINIPILVVFIHNLAVDWKTPFSSHHNLLSVVAILAVVKLNSGLHDVDKLGDYPMLRRVLQLALSYIVMFALLYGSRYTFFIHHLFNMLSCLVFAWLYLGDTKQGEGASDSDVEK